MTGDKPSAVAQDFFQRCFRGDTSSAVELLDPEVTYRVQGSHKLSGTFEGPQAAARHIAELLQETDRTVDVLQWEDWMIGVNNIAALVDLGVQRHGERNTFRSIFLVTMSNTDRIKGIEVFFSDQAGVERFLD